MRLGGATAFALPFLAWLTDVSVNASLSVLGFDAFGAGIELHGRLGAALLLGAVWGATAGAAGALLARATGAAGSRAVGPGRGAVAMTVAATVAATVAVAATVTSAVREGEGGPYVPRQPYRPPNPDTNPYLRVPGVQEPEDARPQSAAHDNDRDDAGDTGDDVYGAPTIARPLDDPEPSPRGRRGARPGARSPNASREWPPPPPPPPPPHSPGKRPE
ncbi:streptophobe family protein [Streptomyces sp. NPDC048297]|uniref:streptophobe family protein n=1 Tax=Streptomyces sp. NPDC048297 TaxID=3365531 RepID=UPI003718A4FA